MTAAVRVLPILSVTKVLQQQERLIELVLVHLHDIRFFLHEACGFDEDSVQQHRLKVVSEPCGTRRDDGFWLVEVVQVEAEVGTGRGAQEDLLDQIVARVGSVERVVPRRPSGGRDGLALPHEVHVLVQEELPGPGAAEERGEHRDAVRRQEVRR